MSNISVEPDTIVKLLRCGLQRGSGHQLTFANATAQQTYFESRVLYSYTDFTYVRENNSIAVGQNVEDIRDCNYMMYQNKNFGNSKWFYAFVTDLEYVNENCTRVYFETDSWQTWMWDFDLHPVFVEREHTNDDTVGANLVPEGLETGEYICSEEIYDNTLDKVCYVMQVTKQSPADISQVAFPYSTNYGGISMIGGAYIANDPDMLSFLTDGYSTEQSLNAIYNVYIVPLAIISNTLPTDASAYQRYSGQTAPMGYTKTITKPTQIGSHTVRNKKLLTYPYNYLLVSNNNGLSNILKYEYFSTATCTFTVKGVPAVGGSIKLIPSGYKGGAEENGIMAGKYPVCNWINDNYTNWLTQNAVNQRADILSNVASAFGGGVANATTGAGQMSTSGVLAGIGSMVQAGAQISKILENDRLHQMQPPSASSSVNGGDVNICSNQNGFFFYKMSITQESAEILDGYFDMYGYKTNKVKYPNLGMTLNNTNYKGRLNWNYVKTIGCTFDAKNSSKMSRQDEINIQQMFDNGVTLWHNPATMYDYSQANTIVS